MRLVQSDPSINLWDDVSLSRHTMHRCNRITLVSFGISECRVVLQDGKKDWKFIG